MCGIVGIYNFQGKAVDEKLLLRMRDTLAHRGPDGASFYISPDKKVGLGHRRLSIIDLSERADQPMSNEDGTVWIVFNGEIYNFQALRPDLEKRGHRFKSNSDTEVIIHLYEEYKEKCLDYLRGMFAFAIWDENAQKLFLARDRVGKKPLKYFIGPDFIVFASELKAILKHPEVKKEPDLEAIDEYLTYQYVPHPKTGFKNIFKLEPAHYLIVKNSREIIKKRYWRLNYSKKIDLPEKEWEEVILEKLKESVRMRLVSDVPLGAHLSGGIDSSLIVALMSQETREPVKTFSIGFKESDYNELSYARLVAKKYNTEHREFIVEPNAVEILQKLVYHYEEPYADSSALPTWYLSEITRNHVTVALNGDGGDENFAGYTRYNAMKIFRQLSILPFKSQFKKLNQLIYEITKIKLFQKGYRLLDSYSADPLDFYLKIIDYFSQKEKDLIYTEHFKELVKNSRWHSFLREKYNDAGNFDWLDRILHTDINSYLADDLLVKIDIASMAHATEVRSPFLDQEFLELTAKIPSGLKIKGHNKKYLIKKIAEKYLPKECIYRTKQGFGVPLDHWFRGGLENYLRGELLDEKFLNYGFKKEGLEKLLQDHKSFKQNYANHLWALLFLRTWFKTWFE
ncbi:MAG: asparagine synthase (glutamine-hydrolyzing) [Parcubacteria group bacterium GW2011_GWA2_38_13b]|nr:MAG: asparagine synthase (glutamine-hydrolyzing) [Parcubacteria group bacterium GW2011_GWA2_38_13b]